VKIVKVLRGRFNISLFGGIGLRKTLIAIQFTVSMVAVITLMIFYKQCLFMANADYGFNRQNILTLPLPEHGYKKAVTAFFFITRRSVNFRYFAAFRVFRRRCRIYKKIG
jgi:hypothetical protein